MPEPRQWSVSATAAQPNEDARYARDGVAVVVDGAGLPKSLRTGCHHSVAWYADRLAVAFGTALQDRNVSMREALSRAITQVANSHDGCELDLGSPSATVAAWRLHPRLLEYLVLCDASVLLVTDTGVVEVTDDRLGVLTAQSLDRLDSGSTQPSTPEILAARRNVLELNRNVAGGFWCCHTDPAAADQAITGRRRLRDLRGVVIASDGATRGYQTLDVHTVDHFALEAVSGRGGQLINDIRTAEDGQQQRLEEQASKVHDDATLLALDLTALAG